MHSSSGSLSTSLSFESLHYLHCIITGIDLCHTWMVQWFCILSLIYAWSSNEEHMIWATVSSRPCFCWPYKASPSSIAKNIINLISVLNIWWCPCIESSFVLMKQCLLWPECSLDKTLLAFSLLYFVPQGQTCLLFWGSFDFLLLHFNPLWCKGLCVCMC